MNAAIRLDAAVSETDNAAFPRASNTNIFDTLPPGQHDTKIIPNATEALGRTAKHNIKVSNGNANNCKKTPNKNGLGDRFKKAKLAGLKLKATDSIIIDKATAMPISEPRPNSKEKLSIELIEFID